MTIQETKERPNFEEPFDVPEHENEGQKRARLAYAVRTRANTLATIGEECFKFIVFGKGERSGRTSLLERLGLPDDLKAAGELVDEAQTAQDENPGDDSHYLQGEWEQTYSDDDEYHDYEYGTEEEQNQE